MTQYHIILINNDLYDILMLRKVDIYEADNIFFHFYNTNNVSRFTRFRTLDRFSIYRNRRNIKIKR